jgi:hypothetical protein
MKSRIFDRMALLGFVLAVFPKEPRVGDFVCLGLGFIYQLIAQWNEVEA